MKVYVVTSGEYSDYHIEGVFLKKEEAEAYVEKRNWNLAKNSCDCSEIEEYEEGMPLEWGTGVPFKVQIASDGTFIWPPQRIVAYDAYIYAHNEVVLPRGHGYFDKGYIVVFAEDEEEAFKKASDIYFKWKAEREGI